jgi:hypothetical protein
MVNQQNEKNWQYGQAAATLLVAYLFVLQGMAVGLAIGANAGRAAFGNAVCVTARAVSSDERPDSPGGGAHGLDACCVQHCSGLDGGALEAVADFASPPVVHGTLVPPREADDGFQRRDLLPVGARAPPSRAA